MGNFEVDEIVGVPGAGIFGRVLESFATNTKLMTESGERTFPSHMLRPVEPPVSRDLVLHPEQRLFKDYCARYELSNPAAGKFFRLLAEELLDLVGWYPGDKSWRFIDTSRVASNLVIRVPVGKTSNIFHLSCCRDTIRVEIEVSKECPPEYGKYFPRKGVYFGGHRKVISGSELNEDYIREYAAALKAVYNYNLSQTVPR
ncbi:MAG: hypothetical protein Q7R35_07070 [Elusimicrobiota bacterium]|nr:hypothetical protein [Elusimicrobiota bacterium]